MKTEPIGTHELYWRKSGFQGADGVRLKLSLEDRGLDFYDFLRFHKENWCRQKWQPFQGWGFRDPLALTGRRPAGTLSFFALCHFRTLRKYAACCGFCDSCAAAVACLCQMAECQELHSAQCADDMSAGVAKSWKMTKCQNGCIPWPPEFPFRGDFWGSGSQVLVAFDWSLTDVTAFSPPGFLH